MPHRLQRGPLTFSGRRFRPIQRPWWKCAWPFRAKAGHDHVRLRMASSLSSAISSHHGRPLMERQDSSSKSGQMLAKQRLHSRCSGSFATTVYHLSSRCCHCTKGENSCSAGGRLVPTEYLFLRRNVRPPLALAAMSPSTGLQTAAALVLAQSANWADKSEPVLCFIPNGPSCGPLHRACQSLLAARRLHPPR
jgi:hypothetical protein